MITAIDGSIMIHPYCKDGMSLLVGIYKSFVLKRAGFEEATIEGYGVSSMDFLYVLFILFFRQPPLYLLIFTKNYLVVLVFTAISIAIESSLNHLDRQLEADYKLIKQLVLCFKG